MAQSVGTETKTDLETKKQQWKKYKQKEKEIKKGIFEFCSSLKNKYKDNYVKELEKFSHTSEPCLPYSQPCNHEDLRRNYYFSYDDSKRRIEPTIISIVKIYEDKLQSKFQGHFKQIGSYFSQTRVISASEFDFLYEYSPGDIVIHETKRKTTRIVSLNEEELSTKKSYHSFAKAIYNIGKDICFRDYPDHDVRHCGFAKDRFSGIRLNEPAVTLQLVINGKETSVDFTLALVLPFSEAEPILTNIEAKLGPLKKDYENVDHQLHLVPLCPDDGEWYITTAILEAQLLKQIHVQSIIKDTIKLCKVVNTLNIAKQIETDFEKQKHPLLPETEKILVEIKSHHDVEACAKLMSVAHILLPSFIGKDYGEITAQCPLTLNSCAIKFHILNIALKNSIRYANEGQTYFESGQDRSVELLKEVFATLADGNGWVKHTFLDYDIRLYTVGRYCMDHMEHLVKKAKELMANEGL